MKEPDALNPKPAMPSVTHAAQRKDIRFAGLFFASALATGIFILDTVSPLQFAVAVLYVVVVVAAAMVLERRGVLLTAAVCCVLTILSYFIAHGTRFEGTAPLRSLVSLAAISITTILVLTNLAANANLRSSERKRVNLSRFLSPQLIEQLAEAEVPLSVARSQRAIVMFVDMVGFTAYSSQLRPMAVIELVRELFALLNKAVFDNHGVIDKFLGDGLLAVFGSPVGSAADASNAGRCALEILHSVDRWNEKRRQGGEAAIRLAVGIHFGEVVFGDVGSETRLELTVLGDTVNLASRVEAYCRVLDVGVLATAAFLEAVQAEGGDEVVGTFLDHGWHVLRGHPEPIHLYGIRRSHSIEHTCTDAVNVESERVSR
jgi:class 3 adenylate cyclase